MREAGASMLRVDEIGKTYGHSMVLSDVSFDLRPQEVVGLLGDNGAGTSTLIRFLSGVVRPSAGRPVRYGRRS